MILIDVRRAEEVAENGVIATEGQTLLTIPLESFVIDAKPCGRMPRMLRS